MTAEEGKEAAGKKQAGEEKEQASPVGMSMMLLAAHKLISNSVP